MIFDFFQIILYEPLFNLLVWIYNDYTVQNFGWAVIYMTIGLRVAMLPISFIDERNKLRYSMLEKRIDSIQRDFHKDPVGERERVRGLMREFGVSPWAKTLSLLIQGLIFVVLYWVFIRGVNSAQIGAFLYSFVDHPGIISTDFFGFNIAENSAIWSGIVGLLLFVGISFEQKGEKVSKSDMYYRILFPLAVFLFLWYLPMVKSLFFLTSISFSYMLVILRKIFIKKPKPV